MNRPQEIPESIFNAIAEKTFEELTVSEKEDVLKYMSAEEYDAYKSLVEDFQAASSSLEFNAEMPVNKEKNLSDSKDRFAFSYLQMAATVLILIALGVGFGQFFNAKPEVLPVAVEDMPQEIKISTPNYVNVEPINSFATEVQLEKIEQVAKQVNDELGSSLEEDDYPNQLIISM